MSPDNPEADRGRPYSGPLRIDALPMPTGGMLGLTHCPGRRGGDWQRNLAQDLDAIEIWRTALLVTLVEAHELAKLGVPDLALQATFRPFRWLHVPIADMATPSPAATFAAINDALQRRERVVIHCAAGLGRTGTVAAALLVDSGMAPQAAINSVRAVRPGSIETAGQEAYIFFRANAFRISSTK